MEIYDQHVHTAFSMDSEAPYVSYLQELQKLGKAIFVTTDHLDFDNLVTKKDHIPDFAKQKELIAMAKKPPYSMKTLFGVELSYRPSTAELFDEFIRNESFDFVLLAVHESDTQEVSSYQFMEGKTPNETYREYLLLCEYAVAQFDNFDSFAHVDYFLRYLNNLDDIDMESHKESLERIFRHLIKKGKSLEYNTRFIYRHHTTTYLEYIFQLYKTCGGEYITLGSDCHTIPDFQQGFHKAITHLKKIGFHSIMQYENRVGHATKI